jgi:hypothetical protein
VASRRRRAPAPLGLQRHLDRDLDADRAGVAEEDVLEPVRVSSTSVVAQLDGGRVGEPAEHHVAHPAGLLGQRGVEHRVPVAVDGRPPRRHPVDQLPAVGEA